MQCNQLNTSPLHGGNPFNKNGPARAKQRKSWSSRRIGRFGAGRRKKTKSNARLKSMEKKSSQTAASKQKPKQERRWIRKEAKGSQCAGKRGGDRATSNAQ